MGCREVGHGRSEEEESLEVGWVKSSAAMVAYVRCCRCRGRIRRSCRREHAEERLVGAVANGEVPQVSRPKRSLVRRTDGVLSIF